MAVGVFPAGNNTDSHSRGPWPDGVYDYSRHTTHPNDAPNSPFGSYGNYIFNVPGCHDTCGVHSGRENVPDALGRIGVKHATNGCIRTTDAAMQLINLSMGSLPSTPLPAVQSGCCGEIFHIQSSIFRDRSHAVAFPDGVQDPVT